MHVLRVQLTCQVARSSTQIVAPATQRIIHTVPAIMTDAKHT